MQQVTISPVETVRAHSVRPQVCAGCEVKYPAKPVMRDDAGVVPCKFLAWQRETAPQAASRPAPLQGSHHIPKVRYWLPWRGAPAKAGEGWLKLRIIKTKRRVPAHGGKARAFCYA